MIASRVLERLGCSVVTAEDGMIALARAATEDWDVILMDGSMPEMDGLEATRAIRSLEGPRARVRIVALTAHALESDRERFQACGMDDYLSKPIDMVRLREALHATCLSLGRHPKRSLADRGDGCELQEAQVAPG